MNAIIAIIIFSGIIFLLIRDLYVKSERYNKAMTGYMKEGKTNSDYLKLWKQCNNERKGNNISLDDV